MADPSDPIASTLAEHPEVAGALAQLHQAVWQAVDPVVLELVRLRIAMLLGNDHELATRTPMAVAAGLDEATISDLSNWPRSERYGARERACLEFVEQFMIDVSTMSDVQTAAVEDHLGATGLADFASAVLVLEQRQRMALTWARIFDRSAP